MCVISLIFVIVRLLSPEEAVREGLAGKSKRPRIAVQELAKTGRGVIALEPIQKGRYVAEYKTASVYPSSERRRREEQHDLNEAGSYVIDTAYSTPTSKKLCFDATERYHHPGRYINHAARGFNLKLKGPYSIRRKWRIGFVAVRDVEAGEELCFDYGLRSEAWMRKGRLVDGRVTGGSDSEKSTTVSRKGKVCDDTKHFQITL